MGEFFNIFKTKKTGDTLSGEDGAIVFNEAPKTDSESGEGETEKPKKLDELFEKYGVNLKDSRFDQISNFIDSLAMEIVMNKPSNWKDVVNKKINEMQRVDLLENIKNMEVYFVTFFGENMKFKEDETVRDWMGRVAKKTFSYNK